MSNKNTWGFGRGVVIVLGGTGTPALWRGTGCPGYLWAAGTPSSSAVVDHVGSNIIYPLAAKKQEWNLSCLSLEYNSQEINK